jgi:hypothetical protein
MKFKWIKIANGTFGNIEEPKNNTPSIFLLFHFLTLLWWLVKLEGINFFDAKGKNLRILNASNYQWLLHQGYKAQNTIETASLQILESVFYLLFVIDLFWILYIPREWSELLKSYYG